VADGDATQRAFGGVVVRHTGPVTQNLRLPGQYADVETGWYSNGFRTYASDLGRYIQVDPVDLERNIIRFERNTSIDNALLSRNSIKLSTDLPTNLYAYAIDNPKRYIDPLGLWQVTISVGRGYGGVATFGSNSGQLNVGAYLGAVQGIAATYNPEDTPATCTGLSTGALTAATIGLYRTLGLDLGGEMPIEGYNINERPDVSLEMSGSFNFGPYATGGRVNVYPNGTATVTPQVIFGVGAAAYFTVGGTYTFGQH
jgi:RHS repeat-associated protein